MLIAIAKWKDSWKKPKTKKWKALSFLWPVSVADNAWDMALSKAYLVGRQGMGEQVREEGDSLSFLVEEH